MLMQLMVYMEFSKDFDIVMHRGLLQKIRKHGIQGKLNWILKIGLVIGSRSAFVIRRLWPVMEHMGWYWEPQEFMIDINDMKLKAEDKISKFANNINLGGVVDSEVGGLKL